ncbi:MAG: HFX_2341 family transcriptional regulator domain-containing protein [Candidatus Thorarchaeota archaeon]|jgi:CRISPR locus-related DNA-binding protein
MINKHHTVYVATVGSSIEPVQRGILYASPDIAYLLYGSSPKLKERNPELVAQKIKENAKPFGLTKCHLVEIDAFSLESVMTEFVGIWQRHMNDNIIANMTGGTNIMASACLLAGFTASAEVIYVRELQEEEETPLDEQVIVLPTPRIPLTSLTEEQQEILRLLLKESETGATILEKANSRIADHMEVTPQTVTHHLRRMESRSLIRREKVGRELNVELTPSGLLFARMLEKSKE